MPKATRYYPPNSPNRNNLYLSISKEARYRRQGYVDALRYYKGNHDIDNKDDIVLNLVKITADRTIHFLFPKSPKFELETTSFENTIAEDYLTKVFENNGGLAFLVKLSTLGFLTGHNFIRVESLGGKNYPKFVIIDPLNVTVFWDENDVNKVLWYEVRYKVGDISYIEDIVYVSDNLWYVAHFEVNGDFLYSSIHEAPIPPIIDWPHYPSLDTYYGVSEFGQKNLQDKINNMVNTLYKLSTAHAEPKDIIIGTSIEDIEKSPDGNLYIVDSSNPNTKVERLEVRGDMAGIGETLDKLIEVYLNVVRVVLLKGEPTDLQRVTNAAVRTLFLDSLSKREVLISTYTKGLVKLAKIVLLMGYSQKILSRNMFDDDITIDFQVPLPVDLSEIVNQNTLGIQGEYLSKATAATRMGLDWKLEQSLIEEEKPLETDLTK